MTDPSRDHEVIGLILGAIGRFERGEESAAWVIDVLRTAAPLLATSAAAIEEVTLAVSDFDVSVGQPDEFMTHTLVSRVRSILQPLHRG